MLFTALFSKDSPLQPIHIASFRGDLEAARREIARNVDLETLVTVDRGRDMTPLLLAIRGDQPEMARLLLEAGATRDQSQSWLQRPGIRSR